MTINIKNSYIPINERIILSKFLTEESHASGNHLLYSIKGRMNLQNFNEMACIMLGVQLTIIFHFLCRCYSFGKAKLGCVFIGASRF